MFSSAARRLVIGNATRQCARSQRRNIIVSSSRRSLVSLTSQQNVGASSKNSSQNQIHFGLHHQQQLDEQRRFMSSDDLPDHVVMGMPALSPTMESGTISKWNVAEGDSFAAGDSLAVIETDKASMDFEAQDDGVVAKLLVPEGGGELNVGLPILVTVEEEGDVGAFANFSADAGGAGDDAPAAEAPAAAPAAAAPATPDEDLPYHVVMGMPALSPTMEAGTISAWNVSEGDSFAAGDSIAVIETDKASMDFEAQDDGVVAKLLVGAGAGEVQVGVPILVTVEEEGDVGAFANFVAGSAPETSATEASAPAPVEEVKAEPVAAAPAPVAATPAPAAPAVVAAAPVAAAPVSSPAGAISLGGSTWGKLAAEKSPLANLLASKQKQYIEKYGSTGHATIV